MYMNFVNSFKITLKHSNNKKVYSNKYHMVLGLACEKADCVIFDMQISKASDYQHNQNFS